MIAVAISIDFKCVHQSALLGDEKPLKVHVRTDEEEQRCLSSKKAMLPLLILLVGNLDFLFTNHTKPVTDNLAVLHVLGGWRRELMKSQPQLYWLYLLPKHCFLLFSYSAPTLFVTYTEKQHHLFLGLIIDSDEWYPSVISVL